MVVCCNDVQNNCLQRLMQLWIESEVVEMGQLGTKA
jgi:hypothetical protein